MLLPVLVELRSSTLTAWPLYSRLALPERVAEALAWLIVKVPLPELVKSKFGLLAFNLAKPASVKTTL